MTHEPRKLTIRKLPVHGELECPFLVGAKVQCGYAKPLPVRTSVANPACIDHLVGRVSLGEIVFWLVSLRRYTHPPMQGAVYAG